MPTSHLPAQPGSIRERDGMPAVKVLNISHCQQCGSEDEATRFNDGYSSCCNERIVDAGDCDDDQCWH